jgi:hypothetical protein
MPGEQCGYPQSCSRWRQTLQGMGHRIACGDRSIWKSFWIIIRIPNDLIARTAIDPKVALQTWSILSRRPGTEVAAPLDLSGKSAAATQTPSKQPQIKTVQLDLIKNASIGGTSEAKGLDRLHQRLATLCPGGLCGFFERTAADIDRCVKSPKETACQSLQPLCDPRSQTGPNSCGRLPADFTESGVLALWAEGADVKAVSGAQLLRPDAARWQPLQTGQKLQVGDLVYLPLTGSIRLQDDDVVFGDQRIDEAEISGVRGHMLAITGASAENLLNRTPKRGALTPAQVRVGVEAGAYDSRALIRENLDRAVRYSVRPQRVRTPTVKEIVDTNSNFELLHRGMPNEKPAGPDKKN